MRTLHNTRSTANVLQELQMEHNLQKLYHYTAQLKLIQYCTLIYFNKKTS